MGLKLFRHVLSPDLKNDNTFLSDFRSAPYSKHILSKYQQGKAVCITQIALITNDIPFQFKNGSFPSVSNSQCH